MFSLFAAGRAHSNFRCAHVSALRARRRLRRQEERIVGSHKLTRGRARERSGTTGHQKTHSGSPGQPPKQASDTEHVVLLAARSCFEMGMRVRTWRVRLGSSGCPGLVVGEDVVAIDLSRSDTRSGSIVSWQKSNRYQGVLEYVLECTYCNTRVRIAIRTRVLRSCLIDHRSNIR
jgi:hypothetical protein